MPSSRVTILVSNDLVTDQRVRKSCDTLQRMGYELLLKGRLLKDSTPIERPYKTQRTRLAFNKGPLFYAELNIRYFLHLFFHRTDIILANDLDTLPAAYLAYRLRRAKHLVYDSHEYFTEVPELQGRIAQKVWRFLEGWMFPGLKHVYTVNQSIAEIYRDQYGVDVQVVRNLPEAKHEIVRKTRRELGLPEGPLLILQGAGINVDRGAEEAVMMMQELPGIYLLILGGGDVLPVLKQMVNELGLEGQVIFKDRMPYDEMMAHTACSDIGLTLDKGDNPNYAFSLPNKIFDYLSAGIPTLASPRIEVKRIIDEYGIGKVLDAVEPKHMAKTVQAIFEDEKAIPSWKENTIRAKQELDWAEEEKTIQRIFAELD